MDGEAKVGRAGTSTLLAAGVALAVAGSGPGLVRIGARDAGKGALVSGRVTLVTAGRVTFSGTPPAGEPIDMSADAYCREWHDTPVVDLPVRVDGDGGVADVLVHVRDAPSGADATEGSETYLDQLGCMYAPAVVAVRVGETLVIRNSDETLHNVRVTPEVNRGFNLGQPIKGIESRRAFAEPELAIPVRCDIHGWMHSTVHVLGHGFFAISRADGSFELPELPPGEYVIETWHRTLGASAQTVTVTAGRPIEIAFELGG